MERPGKVLWDSPGSAAAPHGMLCNPSNAVASPVADNTSSFPNFPALWEEQMTGNVSPSRKQHAMGGCAGGKFGIKAWGKLGRDGGGAGMAQGSAPVLLL